MQRFRSSSRLRWRSCERLPEQAVQERAQAHPDRAVLGPSQVETACPSENFGSAGAVAATLEMTSAGQGTHLLCPASQNLSLENTFHICYVLV